MYNYFVLLIMYYLGISTALLKLNYNINCLGNLI